jgi:hypothetical protein
MRKLLIGPVLTGAGWIAGSYYGAQAQQLVHKSPDETYEGVSHALDNMPQSGTTQFDGGKPVPFELRVDRQLDRQLIVHVLFAGREAGSTQIDFAPQNGGKDTMITAKAHGERAVLTDALAGTSKARLAYAPDWMLNILTVRPLLQQLAQQIETGQQAEIPGMSQADWESSLPPDQQREVQQYRQYEASRPTVDPDADAQRYMSGSQSGNQTANP